MTCVDVYGRDPGYACQPDSGMAGRDGSAGGTTPATTSSGGVGGQRSSSDSGMGNSGGTTASASSAWCTAGDCFNITYQCLDSENGYQRLKTVYCANEKSAACGSATCGTRCVKDGDPILCPAGTSCQLVYRGTGIRWTTPEDACQPLPDGGMSLLDAGLMDGAAKDTRSN